MVTSFAELTTGVNGTGCFDVLMKTVLDQLDVQRKAGRISNDQYATIYPQVVMQTMQSAIQYLLVQQQIISERAKTEDTIEGKPVEGIIGSQREVYDAQVKGFKDDALQKFMKTYVDVWNVQRSTDDAIAPNEQNKLTDANIGVAIKAVATSLGVSIE